MPQDVFLLSPSGEVEATASFHTWVPTPRASISTPWNVEFVVSVYHRPPPDVITVFVAWTGRRWVTFPRMDPVPGPAEGLVALGVIPGLAAAVAAALMSPEEESLALAVVAS